MREGDRTMEKIGKTKTNNTKKQRELAPARTAEERENQLINLAVDLAERKLKDGTASSQIITTLLGLATSKAKLELERIKSDLKVAEAKVRQIELQEDSKDMYEKAIEAFKTYSGNSYEEEDEEYATDY